MFRSVAPMFLSLCLGMTTDVQAATWPEVDTALRLGMSSPADAALIIGNERYDFLPTVPHAERDAAAFYSWVVHTRGVPYEHIQRVRDASSARMVAALERAAEQVEPGGILWVYFSGHGLVEPTSGLRALLGENTTKAIGQVEQTALSLEYVETVAASSRAEHSIIILDTSFAGLGRRGEDLFEDVRFITPDTTKVTRRVTTWTATDPLQAAHVLEPTRHGAFTWAVLGALQGWADGVLQPADGQVTLDEAQAYIPKLFAGLGLTTRQTPSRDLRPEALKLVLSAGRLRTGPSLDDFAEDAIPYMELNTEAAERQALATAERALEEEVRKQVQAQADEAWARALRQHSRGGREGQRALFDFIERFDAVLYPLGHRDLIVSADQVPKARAMLRGTQSESTLAMARFAPAEVRLGSNASDARAHESPQVATLTRSFELAETEVTQEQWVAVMGYNPSRHRGQDHPVDSVSWTEVIAFCNALSRLEGLEPAYQLRGQQIIWHRDAEGYRLPTEAEWELAAGRSTWAGFDTPQASCTHANLLDTPSDRDVQIVRTGSTPAPCSDGFVGVAPVRRFGSNDSRLYDLTGNLTEWVWDPYQARRPAEAVDPPVLVRGRMRVLKGGSYRSSPGEARTAARSPEDRSTRREDVGFRVARTTPDR